MSATAASVEAQAKVNLLLRVVAREHSGYHQLETLFARIELADSVRVATAVQGRSLECSGMEVGPVEQNLAWRAALAYTEAVGWPTGFEITIEKKIPVGGGLGGGSADAGAVLRALNALSPKPLAADALATIAFQLGADVPFLTSDAALALAWGRGERMLGLRSLPAREVLLALPPFGVETRAAYQWFAEPHAAAVPTAPAPLSIDDLDRWDAVTRLAGNDLQSVVAARHPEITQCVAALSAGGARIALMSGSGSSVLGVFDRRPPPELLGLPSGTQVVHTRTSTSVAAVRLLD